MINSTWVKTNSVQLEQLQETSCFKISEGMIFVGTKNGVVQAFNISNFTAVSDVLTFSTYQINNIESYSIKS